MGDDGELVRRLQEGDEAAFAQLVRAHHAALVRLATSIVGSRAVADEVVQDTWLAVVNGVDRFEGRSALRTWLFRILVNRARSTVSRERRSDTLDDIDSDRFNAQGVWSNPPAQWSDQVDDRLLAEQLAPVARAAIDTLPDAQRQVLLLRDVEGLPAADVAGILGVTDGNQRVLLHRARARVRAALEAKLGRP